jgi:hypothetical protein
MGSYPFILGLSKKKRVRAISEVLKHRKRAVDLRTRPSTTKPRRKKGKRNKKLRSISTSQLTNRPVTSSSRTLMKEKRSLVRSFSSEQVSFGLDGTEPPEQFNQSLAESASSPTTMESFEEQGGNTSFTEVLFSFCDKNQDGLLSKDELILGVTENLEVQSMIEAQPQIGYKKLLTPGIWLDEWDNIVTNDVNGQVNSAEFGTLVYKLNQN